MDFESNNESDNVEDKDKSQEEDPANMEQEDIPEKSPEDVPMQSRDAATEGVTIPKGVKQTVKISPKEKDNIIQKKIILEKSEKSGATDSLKLSNE